jgi:hypothetical protein
VPGLYLLIYLAKKKKEKEKRFSLYDVSPNFGFKGERRGH